MAQITLKRVLSQAERLGLVSIAGAVDDIVVENVQVGDLASLKDAGPGTLFLVEGSQYLPPYRLDVAVRQSYTLRLSGLVFFSSVDVSITGQDLANKAGVPLLECSGLTPSELLIHLDRMLRHNSSELIARAQYAISRARAAADEPSGSSVKDILSATSTALGAHVWLENDPKVAWSEDLAVYVGDSPKGRLRVDILEDGSEGVFEIIGLVLPTLASLLSRYLRQHSLNRYEALHSRSDLLFRLISSTLSNLDSVLHDAHSIGFPLAWSHAVALFKLTSSETSSIAFTHSARSALNLYALEHFEPRDIFYNVSYFEGDAVIVQSTQTSSKYHDQNLQEVASNVLLFLKEYFGGRRQITVGLGSAQFSASGIRKSAAEAKIAAESAVLSGKIGRIVSSDTTGLRRILLEFYASPTSRNLLLEILRPLEAQGRKKSDTSIRTLLSYLRNNCSPTRTGADLTLHPNAVSYRINKIQRTLRLDFSDSDVLFALELACRVRILGTEL